MGFWRAGWEDTKDAFKNIKPETLDKLTKAHLLYCGMLLVAFVGSQTLLYFFGDSIANWFRSHP